MSSVAVNLWVSAKVSIPATLLVALVGFPIALALSRPGWPYRRLVDVLINLPLVLPPTVIGYYLLLLLGRDGPVGRLTLLAWGSTLIFTVPGAVLASCAVCLPLFVQAARNALEAVPEEVHEAAQIDGASGWSALRYVLIPVAWPGIWTGVILALARSLGEFGATLMVAGNIPGRTQTMPLAIYSAVQAGREAEANLLALILTSVSALAMWVGLRFRHPGGRSSLTAQSPAHGTGPRTGAPRPGPASRTGPKTRG